MKSNQTVKFRDRHIPLKVVALVIAITVMLSVASTVIILGLPSAGVPEGGNIYLDNLPSTASYVIDNDGTSYWATRYDGKQLWTNVNASYTINSAIDALTVGTIFIRKSPSPFLISNMLQITKSNIEIQSDGAILKHNGGTSMTKILQVKGTSTLTNITIRGLKYDGNKANLVIDNDDRLQGMLYFENVKNVKVLDNEFLQSGEWTFINNYSGSQRALPALRMAIGIENVWIERNYFHDNYGIPISIGNEPSQGSDCRYIFIKDNIMINNALINPSGLEIGAITTNNVKDSEIAYNVIERSVYGISINGVNSRDMDIVHNRIDAGDPPITVDRGDGIEVWNEGISNIKIAYNTLRNWRMNSIELGQSYLTYISEGVTRCFVHNNWIYKPSDVIGLGIFIHGKYNIITNNYIYGATMDKIDILEYMPPGSITDYNMILDNIPMSPMSSSEKLWGFGVNSVIENNLGYNPVGRRIKPFKDTNIALNGNTSAPTKDTWYTARHCDWIITTTVGTSTGLNIWLRDNKGMVHLSNLSEIEGFCLPRGWQINWNWATGTPSFVISAL